MPGKRAYRRCEVLGLDLSGLATYRDLAHCCQARLDDKGRSEMLGAVSQETQAERNQPCRKSGYRSCESSTNEPTVDAWRPRTEGLLHQPIDCSQMQLGESANKDRLRQLVERSRRNRATAQLELAQLGLHERLPVRSFRLFASLDQGLRQGLQVVEWRRPRLRCLQLRQQHTGVPCHLIT